MPPPPPPLKPERAPWLRPRASTWAGIRLMLDTNRRLAVVLFVASAVLGLLPTIFTVASGRLVAAAEKADLAGGLSSGSGRRVIVALVVVAIVFLAGDIGTQFRNALIEGFREEVEAHKRERVMTAALRPPGVAHLEDGEVLDLVRAGSRNDWPNTSAFAMGPSAGVRAVLHGSQRLAQHVRLRHGRLRAHRATGDRVHLRPGHRHLPLVARRRALAHVDPLRAAHARQPG